MHKITFTRNSTGRQMDYMAENLRERHNTYATIERFSTAFRSGRTNTRYWISAEGIQFSFIKTWKELQAKYRELMKQKSTNKKEKA